MMGGAVSSGESNDDLIDNLRGAEYIKTPLVENVFRAVDRAFYYTKPYKQNAYKDMAWKDGNLHISAPCIYSEVMENLQLKSGMSFLNIGSGTGYLSTLAGLILGHKGSNHGIELYEDVTDYARAKLQVFLKSSPALDIFDFCEPQFVVGNCLETLPSPRRYDRIYCGAACENVDLETIIDLLKLGGICVVPINDSLVKMTRVSESRVEMKTLLPVSFTTLVPSKNSSKKTILLPEWNPTKLSELCRSEIRGILRQTLTTCTPGRAYVAVEDEGRKKRRKKRNDRRRSNRLLLVQHRRNGTEGNNGLVSIGYSGSSQDSSGDECARSRSRATPIQNNNCKDSGTNMELAEVGSSVETTEGSTSSVHAELSLQKNESVCDQGGTSEVSSNGHVNCNSQQQLRQTRSEMILGRIRDLVRNRQLERQALQTMQAERASQLLIEVEEALREPPENVDMSMNDDIASGNLENDDDEIDQECVWTSNDSSSSTSSTSTSSSDSESFVIAQENIDSIQVNSREVDVDETRSNDVPETLRHSPVPDIPITNLKANPASKNNVTTTILSNAQIESMEEEDNQEAMIVVHPFSFQMIQKINLLPLPPALKKYLNYHRKM